ncbi:MAG: hypothetical protein KJS95_09215 [Gammaproteobacteria bacterium]|nr:hypothetical protein [Gammaproteobacteria bacterium]
MLRMRGVATFGSLRRDGVPLPRPTRPWLVDLTILKPFDFAPPGDIAEFEPAPDFARWSLGDTPADEACALRWIVIEVDGRVLMICDRVILVRVSWDDLDGAGYVSGRDVSIDGRGYRCRLLSGGQQFRIENDGYSGGAPANEWDRIIAGGEAIDGMSRPRARASHDPLDATARDDPHNKIWNWFGAVSWTSEPYRHKATARVCRGYAAAGYFYLNTQSHRHEDIGWRPVLESVR